MCKSETRSARARYGWIGASVALAAGLLGAGCGTGEILEQQGSGSSGQTLRGEDGRPAAAAPQGGMVVKDGVTAPNRVIRHGQAVAGCDASVQGIGATPLRRLTNAEFDNTVRDVFGVDPQPKLSTDFPRDGAAGPFASNAQGQVTDMYINRYQQAAERVGKDVAMRVETLVPCAPGGEGDDACAQTFIRTIGKRAFRRTLTDADVAGLMTVFTAGKLGATFREGIEYTVQAMLQSPAFMYHLEAKPTGPQTPMPAEELAERLSYFIWGSIPDDGLFAAAADGTLDTLDGLRSEAERMLDDPKAKAQLEAFTFNWLHLDQAVVQMLNSPKYSDFSTEYGEATVREIQRFVTHTLSAKGDGKFETLMTSNKSFPEGAGFKAYGMSGPPAGYDGSQPMEVPGRRAGVITMPASMAAHSSHATSPIKRGVFVLNDVLCMKIELPANANVQAPEFIPGRSIRKALEDVTQQEACMGCHGMINPIGFALEGYDRMGRERTKDEFDEAVDDTGVLKIGDPSVDGPIQGGVALANKIFNSDSGRVCMIQQVFRFALTREETTADTCSFVSMAQRFEKSGFNVRELMLDLVTQDSFRIRPAS